MLIYYILASGIILAQALILVEAYRHLIFTIRKYRPKPACYTPPVALISPCKGLDNTFEKNIDSFFNQDYPQYEIYFIVESEQDAAYEPLRRLIERHQASGGTVRAHLLVSGLAQIRGQKIHNQLAGIDAAGDQATVLAFVDSDACLPRHWLWALVHPLRRKDIGASTGYRWFVPTDNRISTQVLSAMNGFIASLLGPHKWNSAWGGGMAIKRENFQRWGIQEIWQRSCLDDYTLTRQVKKAGLPIAFVPACFVASYEEATWKQLWDFARRQFILTWAYYRQLWWLGVAGLAHFLVGFWGGTAVSLYLWRAGSEHAPYAAILPLFLYFCSIIKAAARQTMIRKILPHDRQKLLIPAIFDLLIQPITAILMLIFLLSTAGSKSIFWRGHRYDLTNPDRVEIT